MPTRTAPVTRWKPTRYGVLVAFMVANRSECKTAEDRLHAQEVVKLLRPAYYAAKRDFDPLTKTDFSAEDFPAKCDAFEEMIPGDVVLTRGAWSWLKERLMSTPESGYFADLRVRVDKSVEDARNEDAAFAE